MSEEVSITPEVEATAATPENVAAPESETPADQEVKKEAEEKRLTQAEVDAIVQKEKAKAEAKAERRALKAYRETLERLVPQQQKQESAPDSGRPKQENFSSMDDYIDAVTDWKLSQRDQAATQQRQQAEAQQLASKTENLYAEAEKIAGFDRESFDELPLTPHIAAAIVDSDAPAKLMAHLASNPDEAERIAKMSPARQAAEIGKLEAKISSAPKASKAPAPIEPIGTRGGSHSNDLSKASMEEYIEQRKKQGARWGSWR